MDPTKFDLSQFNWLAFAAAIVANIIIGFFWYSPKTPTGRIWIKTTGHDMDRKPAGGEMAKSMMLMLVGLVFLYFVFFHTNMVYEDAFRNTATGGRAGYELTILDGVTGGLFTWLGFFVPVQLNSVAFDRKPWSLFCVNAGYYLVVLVLAGVFAGVL